MTVFQFILASLACYRLTVLCARDAGPFSVFKLLRARFKVFACPFCISVWMAFAIEAAFFFSGISAPWVVMACQMFGMSAVAIALDRCFSADYNA